MSGKEHKNLQLLILVGISGSGKSEWAREFIAKNKNYVRANRDELRAQLFGSHDDNYYKSEMLFKMEKAIDKLMDQEIELLLGKNFNVIVDNTHLKWEQIQHIIDRFNQLADIEIKVFDISVKKARERVAIRNPKVNLSYIDKQHLVYKKFVCTIDQYIYKKRPIQSPLIVQDKRLPKCRICDLDGSLSLFYGKNPFDRDFENDTVSQPVADVLLATPKDTQIIFFSGRRKSFEESTVKFLRKAGFKRSSYLLFMRSDTDDRRDSVIKRELYNQVIKDQFYVEFVIDDRLQVIEEVWNDIGLFVFNVNQGNKQY